ncbi:MAG: KR domain-containing protein [Rhodobacteraceae bacterium]|nr:KR domain-containing protein [Paracoccaceae bacterium]
MRNKAIAVGGHVGDAVAIIGMACKLPGGNSSPDEFWDFLIRRKSGISEVPQDRWDVDIFYDPNPDAIAKSVTKWAGFIDGLREFDAQFFGISPREADAMDPQQRLLLQATWEAIEDSRIPAEIYSEQPTGVFVGISQSDYRALQELRLTNSENYAGTGYALCINANRISHRLNLTGPSYAVDTACSSSMVALDQAVRNLRSGSCEMAVVAGVNVLAHPSSFLAFSKAGMLSPTGQISTFDQGANGFVRGEGVGVVIVKPLARALADGNPIHAVIHATAVNQDGRTSTMTAPNQAAQAAMLGELFESSGIDPGQIGFVEAHGTGTPIGDPIEAGAVGVVIGQNSADRPVWVGSGKANVGHLESAAGITGLIKATLAVKHGVVPPNINFSKPNPNIPFDALNLRVPVRPEPFPVSSGTRYAVVNSFGFGGTNASALISSAPDAMTPATAPAAAVPEPGAAEFPLFFALSAATSEGVGRQAGALLKAMSGRKAPLAGAPLGGISRSLATTRSHLAHRAVILARTEKELKTRLRKLAKGEAEAIGADPCIQTGQVQPGGKVCFMFAGQGSQWWRMGRDFLLHNADFADAVAGYDAEFRKAAGWSIREELLRDEFGSRIDDTSVTQPALFAIQAGLAAVWRRFGVTPDMVVGHSIGEAAASFVAGGLSNRGAARFLSKRGAIRDQLGAKGAMASVGLNHRDVEALLPDHGLIGIAAINGPGSTTISGDFEAIHEFVTEFEAMNPDTFIRILQVDTAWHSYQLEAGEDWFRREVSQIDWSVPEIPFISTVTGRMESRFDTDYGWLNLRCPVRFQSGIETALKLGASRLVELGPGSTLAGPATSTAMEAGATVLVLASLSRKQNDFDRFAQSAASLFVDGQALDWQAITQGLDPAVELPRTLWQLQPHWKGSEEADHLLQVPVTHPFLGMRSTDAGTAWKSEINLKAYPYLKDHRLQFDTIFPAASYIDTMLAVAHELFGEQSFEIEDAQILDAMFIGDEQDILLSSVHEPERGRVKLYSRQRGTREEWNLRAAAILRVTDVRRPRKIAFDPEDTKLEKVDVVKLYDVDKNETFVNYGESFQVVRDLWMNRTRNVARITFPEAARAAFGRHFTHPTMLDGCLQVADPRVRPSRIDGARQPGDPVYLPVGAERIRYFAPFPDEIFVHVRHARKIAGADAQAGFVVTDAAGEVLMTVDGLSMRELPTKERVEPGEDAAPHFVEQVTVELRDDHDLSESKDRPGHWLVIGEAGSALSRLGAELEALGAEVDLLLRGGDGESPLDGLSREYADALEAGCIAGIVYACPLALDATDEEGGGEDLLYPIETLVTEMIGLGDQMDFYRMTEAGLPRIAILTSGAYPDPRSGAAGPAMLTQAPIVAVGRALASETPEYDLRMIDADAATLQAPGRLAARILGETVESEVILQSGRAFAPRLQVKELEDFDARPLTIPVDEKDTNFHATLRSPGVIDDLELFEIPLEPMGPNQLRVRISAVGLNFRDIMAITGLLPDQAEPDPAWQQLGLEFGAVVEAVGEKVDGFAPGDRVMGLGRRCLQRFMTVDPRSLTRLPDHISVEQAATIPSAFATAHYALNRVGRMREGERVFIHVATGGVGTAAVQLAQAAGAEIFATAGSPAKRRILKDLGVPHVMDSRSLKFADDVMRITRGEGIDVMLNSLPGDYIAKGLEIMAPYGRFLEIGKVDVYADNSVGMKALRRNVSLSVLDLAAMGGERPELLAEMFGNLIARFEDRTLTPLPVTAFPVSRLSDAVRFMSQARHVGKVVITFDEASFTVRRDVAKPVALKHDGVYLITGGTGGFSLHVADWMSRAGAGELILASRSGRIAKPDARRVARIKARGTKVTVVSLDITDAEAVARQVAARALSGVIHGAAVIRDGFANQLTPEMIRDVLRPKVLGGWNLHRGFEAAGYQPDFFVGFSSIAQVIGSGGQSNYVAGNIFLDALAAYRGSRGLPGIAIDWGVITGSGFVARAENLASYLESVGMNGLENADTEQGIEVALSRDVTSVTYSNADWQQVARANTAMGKTPRFAPLLHAEAGAGLEMRARLLALEGDELVSEASEFIQDEICSVLKIDKSAIRTDRPMSELGLDSLSSFELKMRVETALNVTLPVSKFLKAPSVDELSAILAEEVETIRVAQDAAMLAGDDDGTAGAEPGTTRTDSTQPTNAQTGLLRDHVAPMTSDSVRRGLELQRVAEVASPVTASQLARVAGKLSRRHPVLKLSFDGRDASFDGCGLVAVDMDGPLDVAEGALAHLAPGADPDRPMVALRMHRAVGGPISADILMAEALALLNEKTLPRAVPKPAVLGALDAMRYDPEDPASANDRLFWWYSIAAGATAVPFRDRGHFLSPAGLGRNHGKPGRLSIPLGAGWGEEAEAMVAVAGALRSATGSGGAVLMARGLSLRAGTAGAAAVGPFEIAQPVRVPADIADAVAKAVLQRALTGAERHTRFDCHAAVDILAGQFEGWGASPFQIAFAWRPGGASTKAADAHPLHDLAVEITGPPGQQMLHLTYDSDVCPQELATDIAGRIAGAGAGPASPGADLKTTTRED